MFVDEAWVASRAWALATRGQLTGSLDAGVVDLFPRGWAVFPVVPVFLQSAVYVPADSPTLLGLRMLSLTAGACLLSAVWSIGTSVGGSRTAALAVLLVGLSRPFLYSSHSARYERDGVGRRVCRHRIVLTGAPRPHGEGGCGGTLCRPGGRDPSVFCCDSNRVAGAGGARVRASATAHNIRTEPDCWPAAWGGSSGD